MSIPAPKLQLSQGTWGQHRTMEQVERREAVNIQGGASMGHKVLVGNDPPCTEGKTECQRKTLRSPSKARQGPERSTRISSR